MPTGLIILAIFALLFVWAVRSPNRLQRAIQLGTNQHEVAPILEEIESRPEEFHGRFFESAVESLWNQGHTELAARLTREFVCCHAAEKRSQKWIKKILAEAPDLSVFDTEFLNEHYNPNLTSSGGG